MSADYWLSGIVDNDREEARDAARYDTTRYIRIGGQLYDEADVPSRSDLADEWGDE